MNDYDPNYIPKKNYVLMGQKALIFNNQNQILLLQRSKKAGNAGKWSLAGGALEKNEKPKEGIEREVKEETQLEVTELKPFSVFSYTNRDNDFVVMIAYTCSTKKLEVTLNWEHDEYKWVDREVALKMDLGEHARLLIEEFSNKS